MQHQILLRYACFSTPPTSKKLMRHIGLVLSVCLPVRYWRGWSGGAKVLGKLPVPGRPTIWITVGQGPAALAVGVVGDVWTFLLSSVHSLLFGRRPDID